VAGEGRQAYLRVEIFIDVTASGFYFVSLGVARGRHATPAGAITGVAGLSGGIKKLH
jgi:hypothetical protein